MFHNDYYSYHHETNPHAVVIDLGLAEMSDNDNDNNDNTNDNIDNNTSIIK